MSPCWAWTEMAVASVLRWWSEPTVSTHSLFFLVSPHTQTHTRTAQAHTHMVSWSQWPLMSMWLDWVEPLQQQQSKVDHGCDVLTQTAINRHRGLNAAERRAGQQASPHPVLCLCSEPSFGFTDTWPAPPPKKNPKALAATGCWG